MRAKLALLGLGVSACVCLLAAIGLPALADETAPVDRKTEAAPSGKLTEAELSAAIDREISAVWARDGVTPAEACSDDEFLRRVYIDTVGMPPNVEEALAFLEDESTDKRARLIDALVADPRFGEHIADEWLDIMTGRGRANDNADVVMGVWLAEQVNAGRGFDQVIYDILTAEGKLSENPAVGYFAGKRELLTPDIAGEATKHFTGVQIQCAQCHDHPYEETWKVADFDGVASFFSAVEVRRKGDTRPRQGEVVDRKGQTIDRERLQKKLKNASAEQKERFERMLKWSSPKYLLGEPLKVTDARLWRRAWAQWAIDDTNIQTQRYLANRFWSFLFGMGIHNPVDDFNSFNEASHPELLDLLARDMRDNDYDIRRMVRAVLKTRTWQLSSRPVKAEAWHFANHPVRQLSPEQFFAALIVVRAESETRRGMRVAENPYTREKQQAAQYEKRKAAGKLGENEKRYEYDYEALDKLEAQVAKMSKDWYLRRAASKNYSRFSDDDEMAEADAFSLSIDQALLVMNGEATAMLSNWGKGSVLDGIVGASDKVDKQLERLFIVALARKPGRDETQRFTRFLGESKDSKQAWEDMLFTLLVGTEFATTR
jgi:hypothetical protein